MAKKRMADQGGASGGGRRAKGADTEARILAIATDHFVEYGYELASMRDIATAAGVTPAAIYLYFSDKEALYETACRACFERATAAIGTHVDRAAPPVLQLVQFVRGLAVTLVEDSAATRLFEREIIAASNNHLQKTGLIFNASLALAVEVVSAALGPEDATYKGISIFALTLGLIQFSQLLPLTGAVQLDLHVDGEQLADRVMDIILPGWRAKL